VLIPEIWSRLSAAERNPRFLIEKGYLEKLDDFDYEGRSILASRLGYRITSKFMHAFFGRIFENPRSVFSDEMLKPELQDMAVFADGIENITEAQQRVAKAYFNDGSVVAAIPPVKAILDIMAYGSHNGKKADDPAIRQLFDYDYVVNSDWYNDRLLNKQLSDIQLWQNHYQYVKKFLSAIQDKKHPFQSELMQRLNLAEEMLKRYKSPQYLKRLKGMLGKEATYSIEE
jgi:phosphoenolpyruvate carboxykinase (diphosphate)